MTFQPGQEVRVKNTEHVIGKIVRLRDADPNKGDIYEIELDPSHLYLRVSSIEVLEGATSQTNKLKEGTPQWVTETDRVFGLLRAALDHPYDVTSRQAVVDSLERLGGVVPISNKPATHSLDTTQFQPPLISSVFLDLNPLFPFCGTQWRRSQSILAPSLGWVDQRGKGRSPNFAFADCCGIGPGVHRSNLF